MRKILMTLATIMASMIMMAQSQFYVIMKDGSGASYPENIVDSLTFDSLNGARIYGFNDLANSIAQLRREVDSLKGILSRIPIDSSLFYHEYVDLGLPSGTLWATCNLGAKKLSDYGYYICWGETDQKSNYGQTTGKWYNEDIASLRSKGVIDQYFNLTPQYDAATVLWGEDWRIPTEGEIQELLRYCVHQWTEVNGTNGIRFYARNDVSKSIFLPCAGMIRDNVETMIGTRGYYMGSTSKGGSSVDLYLSQESVNLGSRFVSQGITVRPVRKRANDRPFVDPNDTIINGHAYVDLGLPSGTLWASHNMGADSIYKIGGRYIWAMTESVAVYIDTFDYLGFDRKSIEELIANNIIDTNKNLIPNHDAATDNWGGQWRMPTSEETLELLSNTQQTLTTIKGVRGWLLTGANGKTLFFPITDEQFNFSTCWSSTAYSNDDDAHVLRIFEDGHLPLDWAADLEKRNKPLPIRPVVNR